MDFEFCPSWACLYLDWNVNQIDNSTRRGLNFNKFRTNYILSVLTNYPRGLNNYLMKNLKIFWIEIPPFLSLTDSSDNQYCIRWSCSVSYQSKLFKKTTFISRWFSRKTEALIYTCTNNWTCKTKMKNNANAVKVGIHFPYLQ